MAEFNLQAFSMPAQGGIWSHDLSSDPQFLSSLLRWNNGYLANVLNLLSQQEPIQNFIKGETTHTQTSIFAAKPVNSSKNTQNSTEGVEKLSAREADEKSNMEEESKNGALTPNSGTVVDCDANANLSQTKKDTFPIQLISTSFNLNFFNKVGPL